MFMAGLVGSLVLVGLTLQLVGRPHLMAMPNARSSHTEPTPTMGGVGVVLVVLAYLGWLATLEPTFAGGWIVAMGALGVVGLWDDLRDLGSRLRLLFQFAAAAVVLWTLDLLDGGVLTFILLMGVVWFVNLYNFMDGIDGIAGAQCLTFCLGAQLISGGVAGWPGDILWLLSGAILGFMAFNWPPARIFMGDVGSNFVGLLVAALALHLWQAGWLPLVGTLILLAVFWFDATYTLCVRIVTQQEFAQAHRSHLYQRLALRFGHLWTTVAFLVFSLIWLVPLAWVAVQFPDMSWWALGLSVLPLFGGCIYFSAGTLDTPE